MLINQVIESAIKNAFVKANECASTPASTNHDLNQLIKNLSPVNAGPNTSMSVYNAIDQDRAFNLTDMCATSNMSSISR